MIDDILRHRCDNIQTETVMHVNELSRDQLAIVVWCAMSRSRLCSKVLAALARDSVYLVPIRVGLRLRMVRTRVQYDTHTRTFTNVRSSLSGRRGVTIRSPSLAMLSAMVAVVDYIGRWNVGISVCNTRVFGGAVGTIKRCVTVVAVTDDPPYTSITYERSCMQFPDGSILHQG